MTIFAKGNLFRVYITENTMSQHLLSITLPAGYSVETIHITNISNIRNVSDSVSLSNNQIYTFPAVDGKSPCKFDLIITDLTKPADIGFVIEKFGKTPDIHYFDKVFEPILVTGEDGKEYNMIPSEQFK